MTLYDNLGVDKDATPEDIKRAYRKRASETHPDRAGGSTEKFQLVAKAYEVLTDPEKRRRYDRTGEAESQKDDTYGQLAMLVMQLLDQVEDIDRFDLGAAVVQVIRKSISQELGAAAQADAKAKKLGRAIKRLKRVRRGKNMLARAIEDSVKALATKAEGHRRHVDQANKMLAMWDEYEYAFDVAQAQGPTTSYSSSVLNALRGIT